MSELSDALARLDRAVMRLAAAAARLPDGAEEARRAAAAAAIAAHIDAALAGLGRLLEPEE